MIVTLGDARQSTPTIFKTLNPEWNVSFEMPVIGVPLLECICWDHDRFGKDYLGEFDIPLEDIFDEGEVHQEVRVIELSACLLSCGLITANSRNGIPFSRNGNRRNPRRKRTAWFLGRFSCSFL